MNYSEIKQAVLDWTVDANLESVVDQFMRMTEAKVDRRMKVMEQICRAALKNPSDSGYRYKVPSDFLGVRTIVAGSVTMDYMTPERLLNEFTIPKTWFYTIVDNHFVFKGPTTSDSTIEIYYYQRLVPLTDANPNNWLSDNASDIYLYGCLAEAAHYQFDLPRAQVWEAKFEIEVAKYEEQSDLARWSGSAMAIRAM